MKLGITKLAAAGVGCLASFAGLASAASGTGEEMGHVSDVAPDITVLEEGYNVLVKMPCVGCPFLYQDTSKGEEGAWVERWDENSLLLNISIPYTTPTILINNSPLYSNSPNLPPIHAAQVLSDTSTSTLSEIISSRQLDAPSGGGATFGLSYRPSLSNLKTSGPPAKLFHLDIFAVHTTTTTLPPSTYALDRKTQKILRILFLQKPLLSAASPAPTWEIVDVKLVPRPHAPVPHQLSMDYLSYDTYGKKGSASHFVTKNFTSFMAWVTSGFWGLFLFIIGCIVLFVLACLFCVFGWGFWDVGSEYESAQSGKRGRERAGTGTWAERGVGGSGVKGRFLSPEELGLARGRVVGLGKVD